jgi:hypothetical protein
MQRVGTFALPAAALALLGFVTGCGGAGSESEGQPQTPDRPASATHEFVIPGGDNTVQYFGHEAGRVEREEVSAVVEAWDRARAARNWRLDCRYLTQAYIDNLVTDAEGVSKGEATSCIGALVFFGVVASGGEGRTTTGLIDSLRVSGRNGYAQYHGRNGQDWIVPVEEERGVWRVGVSAPINRQDYSG